MKTLGAILAGGEARRFGSDKALAQLHGRPLIEHVREALAAQTDAIIVCGRDIPDRPAPSLGPLGGLAAALHYARENGFDQVLTAPCDVPHLPPDLRTRLRPSGYLANLPVIGLWPAHLSEQLDAHLASGADRSVRRWAALAGIAPREPGLDLANINTPADLAALETTSTAAIKLATDK